MSAALDARDVDLTEVAPEAARSVVVAVVDWEADRTSTSEATEDRAATRAM
jgi:hypothetical protein